MPSQSLQWSTDVRADEVDQILAELIEAEAFRATSRQAALLRYLLTAASGPDNSVKEHDVAIDVFGRGPEFDPSKDSIVRSELYRLRKSLNLYNLGAKSSAFKVSIPQQSYSPEIVRSIDAGTSKLSISAFAFSWRYFLALLMVVLLFVGGYVSYSKIGKSVQLQEPIAPVIGFILEGSESPLSFSVFQKFQQKLTLRLAADGLYRLNDSLEPDYTLHLSLPSSLGESEFDNVALTLFGDNGGLLWTKRYNASGLIAEEGLEKFTRNIYADMFFYDGVIPRLHATGLVGSVQSTKLYRCLLDVRAIVRSNISSFNSEEDLERCLLPSVSSIPDDQAFIALNRGMLYLTKAVRFPESSAENNLEIAEQQLVLAKDFSSRLRDELELQLLSELIRHPVKNTAEVKRLAKKVLRLYPEDEYLKLYIARIYGTIFGDWESASLVMSMEKGAPEKSESRWAINSHFYLLNAIVKQEFELAREIIMASKQRAHIMDGIYQLVVGWQANDPNMLASGANILKKNAITSEDAMWAYVETRGFHAGFEQVLLAGWSNTKCLAL